MAVDVQGIPLHDLSIEDAVDYGLDRLAQGETTHVVSCNLRRMVLAYHSPKLLKILQDRADLVLPNSITQVVLLQYLGYSISNYCLGVDFLKRFIAEAGGEYPIYFMGAEEGVAERAVNYFMSTTPTASFAGAFSPPFSPELTDDQSQEMMELICGSGAKIIFLGLTALKEWTFAARNYDLFDGCLVMGLGRAFNYFDPDQMLPGSIRYYISYFGELFDMSRKYRKEILPFLSLASPSQPSPLRTLTGVK